MQNISQLILQCRIGFEKEAAAEITDRLSREGVYGYCQLEAQQGYLCFVPQQPEQAMHVVTTINFTDFIYIRQWAAYTPWLDVSPEDRVGQLLLQMNDWPKIASVWVEYPDTTEARELATFARKFSSAMVQKLKKDKRIAVNSAELRLQVFVLSGERLAIGLVPVANSAPWPQGIPRLKFPKSAPSRSTLKLEEAWHWFIPRDEWDLRLSGGQTAVDLGAAPGGWTWQLVNRSMFVTAVDNGPMSEELMESGQVAHSREDGYAFKPEKPVDWLVCDMADKPMRTARMMVEWSKNRWFKEAIINFKLPMKQRFKESEMCLEHVEAELRSAGIRYELRAKHLYHDREEITCHLRLI